MSTRDHFNAIQNPTNAIVRDRDGDERIEVLLPIATVKEHFWNSAHHSAVQRLAKEIYKRGDHDRSRPEIEQSILDHLNRDAMAAALAREYLSALAREIKIHLEIPLDIQLGRVEVTSSGFIELLFLTMRPSDAAKVFNCMVSIDRTGQLESLREHTAVMRNWEWGLLFINFIRCIDRVCRKRSDVDTRLLRQLCKDKDILRKVLVEGLNQRSLKLAIYGPFPDVDRRTSTLH